MIKLKIVDLKLNIDGLILSDDETVDDVINQITELINSSYPIQYEVLYEEE